MRIMFALILSLTITPNGWADKAGVYAGAGVTWLTFDSENEVLDDAFDSDNDIGFRIEVGYIWDIGKPDGFMLGARVPTIVSARLKA